MALNFLITPPQQTPVLSQDGSDRFSDQTPFSQLFTKTWYLFFGYIQLWVKDLNERLATVEGILAAGTGPATAYALEQTLTANTAIASPVPTPAAKSTLAVFLKQDGTGGWTITWDATFQTDTPTGLDGGANTQASFWFVATAANKWRLAGVPWQPTI